MAQPIAPTPTTHGPLHDKVVVVTGAGRGLGLSIAIESAKAGAFVVGTVRSEEALRGAEEALGPYRSQFKGMLLDLRDGEATTAFAADVVADLGKVDVLVNNSGIAGPTQELISLSDEDWDEVLAVNLTAVFRCCRALLPHMIERRSGSIITIGSLASRLGLLNRSPYTAVKSAVVGFTRTLALEAGPSGVRANVVTPGPIAGPRFDEILAAQALAAGRDLAEFRAEWMERTALRRFAEAEDIANAVVFLASDGARSITGIEMLVTAGYAFD